MPRGFNARAVALDLAACSFAQTLFLFLRSVNHGPACAVAVVEVVVSPCGAPHSALTDQFFSSHNIPLSLLYYTITIQVVKSEKEESARA